MSTAYQKAKKEQKENMKEVYLINNFIIFVTEYRKIEVMASAEIPMQNDLA